MINFKVKEQLLKIIGRMQDCGAVVDRDICYNSCSNQALVETLVMNNVSVFPCRPGQMVYEIIYDSVVDDACICEYIIDDVSFKAIKYGGNWISWEDVVNVYFDKEEAETALAKGIYKKIDFCGEWYKWQD